MDGSLSSRLASLRGQVIEPADNLTLLRIALPFLYHQAIKEDKIGDQVSHYIMEYWYVRQPKFVSTAVGDYCTRNGSCCCFQCGNLLGSTGCSLADSCMQCRSDPKATRYLLGDFLWFRYKIHPSWVDFILSEYLASRWRRDKGYSTNNLSGLTKWNPPQ